MSESLDIAFFGSSLVSSYWNGASTYYRGIISALHTRGHRVTFFEPDAFDRQAHRDIDDPPYARVVVYPGDDPAEARRTVARAAGADVVVKTSGVGVYDDLLEEAVLEHRSRGAIVVFWDVDAPATLARLEASPGDPFLTLLPEYDLVLTYGGGDPVVRRYLGSGARACRVVYNALDPSTHHPVAPDERFRADVAFLANRLPDREARVEEFFFRPAALLPERVFLLGGSGWDDRAMPPNVRYVGHVSTRDHNAVNSSALAILNVHRESMVANGYSPATRLFEAAGAAACQITDEWEGIDLFLDPGREVLVAADGAQVAEHVRTLEPHRARSIGEAARSRVLSEHTYANRAAELDDVLRAMVAPTLR